MVIRFAEIAGISLSLLNYPLVSLLLFTMSSRNQIAAFRHYVPSNQTYHIQHTHPTTTTTPLQTHLNYPRDTAHDKSVCCIKPAPTIPSATSSSYGGTSGQKHQYRFVYYSPR